MVMETLGPLPKAKFGNRTVIVSTDRYTNLTRAVLVTIVASTNATTMFVDNWVNPCGIPTYLLTEKRP